jgi:hypothetical protein
MKEEEGEKASGRGGVGGWRKWLPCPYDAFYALLMAEQVFWLLQWGEIGGGSLGGLYDETTGI